jgi:hypothetical protein
VHRAVRIAILEQLLPGQLPAPPHDGGDARVVEARLVPHAALALEGQAHFGVAHAGVAAAQRREPVRTVAPRVLLVADAQEGRVEQADDRREHERARRARARAGRQIALHACADAGQGAPKSRIDANLSSSRSWRQAAW